ncbi:MAG: response regulator, partial [Acetatifactor sp.]|nr:response regulator [Acetatifactor sp.]
DYEVITAKSGLSAFRNITLVRPDLVLLDYEMPVCNGSQFLEMLRSEKDLTDIPVIFLTSRVDRESIRKVIALKPERYLSKALPPKTVKEEIDHFFEQNRQK